MAGLVGVIPVRWVVGAADGGFVVESPVFKVVDAAGEILVFAVALIVGAGLVAEIFILVVGRVVGRVVELILDVSLVFAVGLVEVLVVAVGLVEVLVVAVVPGFVSEVVLIEVVRFVGVFQVFVFVFEIFEGDAVHLVEARQGVRFLVLVGDDGAGERLPGGLGAPRGEQGLTVGVEQPRRPRAQPTVS